MPAAVVSPLRAQLHRQRDAAIARWRQHQRAETLLKALSRFTDQALRATVRQHPLPAGAALVAVGGYGRGELFPHSDVDILILLGAPPSPNDQALIQALVAACWDLGLDLAHSVRAIVDCQRQAANDLSIETALMESRWIAGDTGLVAQLQAVMQHQRDPRSFFLAKRAEQQQRHARYQDTPYALEPHCKESPGGLRDLNVILWMTQAAGIGRHWREIISAGFLHDSEYRALRRAELAFKRLRIELHLLTGRREDRVLFDLQPQLADIYGFTAARTRRPSELLMQRYYWAARVVSLFNTLLLQALEEHLFPSPARATRILDQHFKQVRNRLDIRQPDVFELQPGLLLKAIHTLQERSELTGMTATMMRAIWHARKRIDTRFRRKPEHRQAFIQIVQHPTGALTALRHMNRLGLLARYLPEFRRIVGQMQHDLFHAYTVDEHILKVIGHLHRFKHEDSRQDAALAHTLMTHWAKPWLLDIAALYHDIAKGQGGDHSSLGAQAARQFCQHHALSAEDTELIVFLVDNHLVLSRYAQKRDLTDPAVILEFTALANTQERLTALYLLTVADIRGTSPKVWNAWKGRLIDTLYQHATVVLGGHPPDTDHLLAQRQSAVLALLEQDGLPVSGIATFWQQLDDDYFARHDTHEIAWHMRHLYHQATSATPIVKARVLENDEGIQVLVYAPDRADLFVDLCHAFALYELNVQEARIHTTRHGWALDSFIVLPPVGDTHLQVRAHHLERDLPRTLQVSAARTNQFRARPSRRVRTFPIVPHVELTPDPKHEHRWRLSLVAADRRGLLYNLALCFAAHGINLRMAKIMTLSERVEDIFLLESDTLHDPLARQALERDLITSLSFSNPKTS